MATSKVRGGHKIKAIVEKAKRAQRTGVREIEVGFFATARYPEVTQGVNGGRRRKPVPVTTVAAAHEYGIGVPHRPFFSNAIRDAREPLMRELRRKVNPVTMTVDRKLAMRLGLSMQYAVQKSITDLRTPPNSPATVALKGSSNPLIDEGFMRMSVTYKVY